VVVRYLVRGAVQGVGFRWFVMREAHRLSMRGWVSNLADGSVEVVADGPAPLLADLERMLARGPSAAQVTGVEKMDVPHDMVLPSSFEIK
jgi:acylphosphatase